MGGVNNVSDASYGNLTVTGRLESSGILIGYKKNVIALTNASITARPLLASESGSLVTLYPSTAINKITVTMPAVESGLEYTFALIGDVGNSAQVILQTTSNDVDFKGMLTRGNAANAENASDTILPLDHSKITFNTGALKNTIFTCVCNGSHWITTGNSTAVSGLDPANPVLGDL